MKLSLIVENILKEKTSQDLQEFLEKIVPFLVRKNIVGAQALKACSGISSEFEYFAKKEGFKVVTAQRPGHFFNYVGTTDGTFLIDLSHIQFVCKLPKEPFGVYDDDPEEWDAFEEAFETLLKQIHDDPFSAIKVKKIGGPEEFSNFKERFRRRKDFDKHTSDYYDQTKKYYDKRPDRYLYKHGIPSRGKIFK